MRMHPRRRCSAAVGALAGSLLLLPVALAAQEVRGVVSDVDTRAPVAGAMVLLLAADDAPLAQVLTAEDGGFVLTPPTPGRFRLRVDRIGYASVLTDPFDVVAGQRVERNVATGVEPVRLEGIDVEGARRCEVRPAEGLATARVWEEARKALAAAAWTAEREMYRFAWTRFVREVAPDGRRVLEERRTQGGGYTPQPFVSVSADRLAEEGFVGMEGGDNVYYAPDANVLLSNAFLDTHCFALEDDEDSEGLIGLRFEPVRRRHLPDVEGVMWVERVGARLRSLAYDYVNLGRDLEGDDASGEIHFRELPNGTWIVEQWRIRMPRVEEHRGGPLGALPRYGVAGYRDEGGAVRRIVTATGERVRETRGGTSVSGTVVDSLGAPLAGVRVTLTGTERETTSGVNGGFSIDDVPPGRWSVAASQAALDALGHPGASRDVEVDDTPVGGVLLELPGVGRAALDRCEESPKEGEGAVFGFVVERDGAPAAGADVHALWTEVHRTGLPNSLRLIQRGLAVRTDERGVFVVCGIPLVYPTTVTASLEGRTSEKRKATLDEFEPVAGVRIVLPPEPAADPADAERQRADDPSVGRVPNAEAAWLARKGFPLRTEEALLHLTGGEVRRRALGSVARILEETPRVEVRGLASGGHELRLHDAAGWTRDDPESSWCVLDLYLNGNLARRGTTDPALTPDRLLDTRLRDLSGVEVFDGLEAPVTPPGGCGVVLLWFHRLPEVDVDFEGRISGRVVMAPDGSPATGFGVTLHPGGIEAATDDRGHFDFGRLPPARYRIDATLPGWGTWSTTVPLKAGDNQDVTIRVEVRGGAR